MATPRKSAAARPAKKSTAGTPSKVKPSTGDWRTNSRKIAPGARNTQTSGQRYGEYEGSKKAGSYPASMVDAASLRDRKVQARENARANAASRRKK